MRLLRWILLPVALAYGVITYLRNKCYDYRICKSHKISGKSILVGNLSVGGTGKTPHVDYLIQHFLQSNINLSTLSRGYGRKTRGVLRATENSTHKEIGDEPTQYKKRYKDQIEVVVAEKRKDGVKYIQANFPQNELILLDDAFQHRAISAGFNILITPYDDLFIDDMMLPTGNLREWRLGKNRANCIIVSKTPKRSLIESKKRIQQRLDMGVKPIFFSSIEYGELVPICGSGIANIDHALIVTGIGNPEPLLKLWEDKAQIEHLAFPDHHNYTQKDIANIHQKFGTFASRNKAIITTEKDFMRLRGFKEVFHESFAWHYQPITIVIDDQQKFNKIIDEYVRKV